MQTMDGGTVPTKGGLLGPHPPRGGVSTEIQNLAPSDDYRRGGSGLSGRREKSCNEEKEPNGGGEKPPCRPVQKRAIPTLSCLFRPTSTLGTAVQEILCLFNVHHTKKKANRTTPEMAADPQLKQPQVGSAEVDKCWYKQGELPGDVPINKHRCSCLILRGAKRMCRLG